MADSLFRIAAPGTSDHILAQNLVAEEYRRHFGSAVSHPLAYSLNLHQDDELVGCMGFSPALDDTLFLEQYLDEPIESMIAATMRGGAAVFREEIVEIGSFAVRRRQYALPLMIEMAQAMLARGFTTAVCTATGPVAGCLGKLGIAHVRLARADASRIPDANQWGSYYALDPVVLGGDIAAGVQSIKGHYDACTGAG
ncbi:MAG: thermostable hemolysin [Pseudomonadales bacterium]